MDNFCVLYNEKNKSFKFYSVSKGYKTSRDLSKPLSVSELCSEFSGKPEEEGIKTVLNGLSNISDGRINLDAYLLRCRLGGLPIKFSDFISHSSTDNMFKMSYEELMMLPVVHSTCNDNLSAIENYDRILLDNTIRFLLTDIDNASEPVYNSPATYVGNSTNSLLSSWLFSNYALYYNFDNDVWIFIERAHEGVFVSYKDVSGKIHDISISKTKTSVNPCLSDVLQDMGLCLNDNPRFFRVDSYFQLVMQVYLKNPSNLNYLSNEIFRGKEDRNKTGRLSIGFFTLELNVLDKLLKSNDTPPKLGVFTWGYSRKNWRDEYLQERIRQYL